MFYKPPKVSFEDHGNILNNIIPYFRAVDSVDKADAAVLWTDVACDALKHAKKAKELNKPLIVVQHGRCVSGDYLPPVNYPLLADKLCVWGVHDYLQLIRSGLPANRIVLTGSPLFDGVDRKKNAHNGVNVIFAPKHWQEEVDENREIIRALHKIRGINVLAKILPVHEKELYGNNLLLTRSHQKDHINRTFEFFRTADVLVSNQAGTVELLALYLDIPVIFVDNAIKRPFFDNKKYALRNRTYRGGTEIIKDVSLLEGAIKKHLDCPTLLQKERSEELLMTAGVGIGGRATQRIVDVINESIKTKR